MRRTFSILSLLAVAALGSACSLIRGRQPEPAEEKAVARETRENDLGRRIREATRSIDDRRIARADDEPENWLAHGRTRGDTRFSPLDQIDAENVSDLKLKWTFDTNTNRGLEATPLVVDGVIYATGSWSVVFAIDARTGKAIWTYDPKVPKEVGQKACCDVVNRGVALYKGRVYVGTLDGRLVALDAASGEPVWEVWTVDPKGPFTITGAPRVAGGKIFIGFGGAEYGVRGAVNAYDAETGKLVWRSYTVPGDPSKPPENEAMKRALPTWPDAERWLRIGAGGTVWDSMAYDPELNLLYVGTGNGVAWDRKVRSPGGGDNLYLTSILALDADTGEIKWHYQTTPGDTWDFDSCQQMILADLKLKGRTRRVLMQAPKNGFFYIFDRETGELLSAEKYVEVTWAKRVDLRTGRPVEAKGVRYEKGQAVVKPSAFGGHSWHAMSYSPLTGLVYIPAQEIPGVYESDPQFELAVGEFNTALDLTAFKDLDRKIVSGHLLAWDPVRQREAWRAQYKLPWNGGTLATAGNLVFQGTSTGRFIAYRATDGKKLWETKAPTAIIAPPVTYTVDGVQHVTVLAGWGGIFALAGGDAAAAAGVKAGGHILTFALEKPPAKKAIAGGEKLYHQWCVRCHGAAAVGGGVLPDLRHLNEDKHKVFHLIVKNGIPGTAMPGFGKWLGDGDAHAIQAYLRSRAAEEEKTSAR